MAILADIKSLLQITDDSHDAVLNICITEAENRLKAKTKLTDIPTELEHITRYVAMARYNAIGAEGKSNENIYAVGSTGYKAMDTVIAEFKDELKPYLGKRLVMM